MRMVLPMLILALGLPVAVPAQQAPDSEVLTQLLKDFLAGASRNDAQVHDRFWAEDLIYTGSTGRRIGKAEIMDSVRSAPAPQPGDPATVYSAEDIRVQLYDDTAVVAFLLVASTEKEGKTEVQHFLNTGTFLKRDDQWRVVAWQATKKPDPTP